MQVRRGLLRYVSFAESRLFYRALLQKRPEDAGKNRREREKIRARERKGERVCEKESERARERKSERKRAI